MLNGTRPTLLVVDDEEVIGLSLRDSLDEAGFAVQFFANAAGVLESFDRITIAAAIIDVGLPACKAMTSRVIAEFVCRSCRSFSPLATTNVAMPAR